jgi:hypothetical protein
MSSSSTTPSAVYYRHDGVRITHDPYAPEMASKYGAPGQTDRAGFDPYADSVGAGIYSGAVRRRADGMNPKPENPELYIYLKFKTLELKTLP